jgi:hypothetical protein
MKTANEKVLKVAKDFSTSPGPRYIREGDFSGELFRNTILEKQLKECIATQTILLIDLDGTAGFGTSFLEEAFGGLIRVCNINYNDILKYLQLKSEEEPYLLEDVAAYMKEAQNENK